MPGVASQNKLAFQNLACFLQKNLEVLEGPQFEVLIKSKHQIHLRNRLQIELKVVPKNEQPVSLLLILSDCLLSLLALL